MPRSSKPDSKPSFSVLTVSKRTGWEKSADRSIRRQTIQPNQWIVVTEESLIFGKSPGPRVIFAPEKTKPSNLNASLNAGLKLIKEDYVIFFQDNIELKEDCFEKLLSLADEKTFVTTCTPNYDGCFVAGTPILTPDGYQPIETIKPGDYVWTPFGKDKVISSGMTGIKPTFNYGPFICTEKHPIITSAGVVPIDELRYNKFIWKWQENPGQKINPEKQFTFLEYLISATLSPRTAHTAFIFKGLLTRSLAARLAYSTEKSGNTIMAQYQRAIKSITQTDTMTTRLKALSLFLRASTQSGIFGEETREHERVLNELENLLKNGTVPMKVDGGILSAAKLTGPLENIVSKNVYNAILGIAHDMPGCGNTVAITARPQRCGDAEVWNLATENGLYIANGVLVGNSDDGRYTGADLPRPCRPEEWEANVAIAPMSLLRELGGFEEELDWGWSWDNVHLAKRAAMLGARFVLDESNRPKLLPHEMKSREGLTLNGEWCEQDIEKIRRGEKPVRLPYL